MEKCLTVRVGVCNDRGDGARARARRYVFALLLWPTLAFATPSTTFWAPSTPYIQPFGVPHITYDTYFTGSAAFPIDTGLTIGFLPFDKFQGEVGFDFLYPTADLPKPDGTVESLSFPVLFNGKIGSPEGAFGDWSPAWSAGVYNVGVKKNVTNFNVFHLMTGKTFPYIGEPEIGFYHALNGTLVPRDRTGVMAGWFSPDIDIKKPYLDKIVLAADVQAGKNVLGAWGGGIYFYFTPQIDLLTGPVFFLNRNAQGPPALIGNRNPDMIWTLQLDIDLPNIFGSSTGSGS